MGIGDRLDRHGPFSPGHAHFEVLPQSAKLLLEHDFTPLTSTLESTFSYVPCTGANEADSQRPGAREAQIRSALSLHR